jgi:hypothetical protein
MARKFHLTEEPRLQGGIFRLAAGGSLGAFNRKGQEPDSRSAHWQDGAETGEEVWLALAAIRLIEAKGFSGQLFQFER